MKKQRFIRFFISIFVCLCSVCYPCNSFNNFGCCQNVNASVAKLSAPKGFKATKITTNTIKLTWKEVPNADAYRVFMFNSDLDEYETYRTINGTSCTIKNLVSDRTYKFKVAALVKNGNKYSVQTKSEKLVVKTNNSKPKLTNRKKPTEFKMPYGGDSVEDVLKNCGIANWKDISAGDFPCYSGTVLFSDIESRLFVGFNSKRELVYYELYIPCKYAFYSGFLDATKESLGSDYEVDFKDGDTKYSWKFNGVTIRLSFDWDEYEMHLSSYFD